MYYHRFLKRPLFDEVEFGFGPKGQWERCKAVAQYPPSVDKEYLYDYIEKIHFEEDSASWILPRNS
jgi:hypothetical protein